MDRPRWRRRPVMIVAIVAIVGAAAIATISSAAGRSEGSPAPRATGTSSPVPVVVPGRPGESAAVISSDRIPKVGDAHNLFDVWFVRMMIPHHAQAVEMAALAPTRARSPQIVGIASRIQAAQVPEVARLKAWLKERGLPENDASHTDHSSMKGMQSAEAMRALAGARGDAFDRMFVQMMVDHHQGAIDMATDVLKVGTNIEVGEIATGIAAEQMAEIGRLREAVPS